MIGGLGRVCPNARHCSSRGPGQDQPDVGGMAAGADGLHQRHLILSLGRTPSRGTPARCPPEKVRIPEVKGRADALIFIGQRVFCPPDPAVFPFAGGAEDHVIADLPHVRRVVVHIQLPVFVPSPNRKVVGIMEARAHAGKRIVGALNRISVGSAASRWAALPYRTIVDRLFRNCLSITNETQYPAGFRASRSWQGIARR